MWSEVPITKRAPRIIFLFLGINVLSLIIAVAKGAQIASVVLTAAIFGTTLLYVAASRAARKDRNDRLKLYMNLTVVVYAIAAFVFLAAR